MGLHALRCYSVNDQTILLLAILLILSNSASAYIRASLERACTRDEDLSSETELQPDSQFFRQRSLLLDEAGHRSAALLQAKMSDPPCSLVIEVPKDTHAISVSMNNFPKGIPCPLWLWYHGGASKNETWSLDLCDREKRGILALYPEVYPYRITLRWYPVMPKVFQRNDSHLMRVLNSEESIDIVATAVARGILCDDDRRVLCWKMMKESLCVSEQFACDGYQNCPYPGNDESKTMCPPQQQNDHLNRILAVRRGDRDMAISSNNRFSQRNGFGAKNGKRPAGKTNTEDEEVDGESEAEGKETGIFGVLPRLGPGSFVLLAMLIFGSILLLCGIWECCCRARSQSTIISLSPRGSMAAGGMPGNAITLVTPPPQYDELEQPPNYKELFPVTTKTAAP